MLTSTMCALSDAYFPFSFTDIILLYDCKRDKTLKEKGLYNSSILGFNDTTL